MRGRVDTQELQNQILGVCTHTSEPKKKSKQLENTCLSLVRQLGSPQKSLVESQANTISIIVSMSSTQKSSSNEELILECLLYLFARLKQLRIKLQLKSSHTRPKDNENNTTLVLNMGKILTLSPKFAYKLHAILRQNERSINNQFDELGFKCIRIDKPHHKTIKIFNNICSQTELFIASFYHNLDIIFAHSPIFILKNTLNCLPHQFQQSKLFEVNPVQALTSSLKQVFSRTLLLKGLSKDGILQLSNNSTQKKVEMKSQQERFDTFSGSPMQYLQKVGIFSDNFTHDLSSISSFLRLVPNITILQCVSSQQTTIDNIDLFLQQVIKSTPLIKRIYFKDIRVTNISLGILQRLYIECPFLVQLQIGLNLQYSLPQTYDIKNVEQRDAKLRQRQINLILDAIRLRSITLQNNMEMTRLLITKGFNFLSSLEIVDCIEPVCF